MVQTKGSIKIKQNIANTLRKKELNMVAKNKVVNFLILTISLSLIVVRAFAVSNYADVPVLVYHSWHKQGCTAETNDSLGLASDLETLKSLGFTVVPVYWISQWATGNRDGSTLPDKIVGITFDDGADQDWYDSTTNGCFTKSMYHVLQDFKNKNPDLPWYSPHASSFVIGSPKAREIIGGESMTDEWWYDAHHSGLMEIYNHSADHDHDSIVGPIRETSNYFTMRWIQPGFVSIAAGGYSTGNWNGQGDFQGITSFKSATVEVQLSGNYIKSKIGMYPDLFAYPYGGYTPYLVDKYFPKYSNRHQTYAAFSGDPVYVNRSSNRWTLGRFVRNRDWTTQSQLIGILNASGQ